MKTVEKISEGANFSAVNVGKMDELIQHELHLGPEIVIPGKVFVGQDLKATGAEMSFQYMAPGQDSGILHTHKTHEELYIIVKGSGEYQVDGDIFPITEGSVVRVAPKGKRALRNTGKDAMVLICIQYKGNSFGEADSPSEDGVMLNDKLVW